MAKAWPAFMHSYGVGTKQRTTHVPAAVAQLPAVTVSKQALTIGGIAATEAQTPPAATTEVQNFAAQVTHSAQAAGSPSALGIREEMTRRMAT